ncbi:MAG TPA: alpha/beta hydrolase [Thermoanaerobaculia bacterium]|jgi:3-oxoadipate enol-lactonase
MRDLVWIHGFPLSNDIFAPQRAIGGANHLMPNLPGFGGTPADADTIEGFAASILAQHRGPAIFAGMSMGGYVAMQIARIAPELVEGLILIDTRETADTPEQRQGRFDTIAKVEKEGIAPVVEAMLPKMLTANAPDALRAEVRRIMESSSREGVIAGLRAMAGRPSSFPVLASLTVPILIAVGEEDTITPPSDAERMANNVRHGTLLRIPDAAHLANMQQPGVFNEAVERFLGTIGNAR